jgi:3-methyladenine DNA glycosylase AlkD
MDVVEIISHLNSIADPTKLNHMKRYGINTKSALGISVYDLRRYAREIGPSHMLALDLWLTGIHDARLLACFIEEPKKITSNQMDHWADDFDSWDLCDQACTTLFDKSHLSWGKIFIWAESEKEFVKRAAFSLIAGLSIHDKDSEDRRFEAFFPLIRKHAVDERHYVKKAVNWALRNIGKRNISLHKKAIICAKEIDGIDSRSARWIAKDALRELQSKKIIQRLKKNG